MSSSAPRDGAQWAAVLEHAQLIDGVLNKFLRKYGSYRQDRDALRQESVLAVERCLRTYDPQRGEFSKYASTAIWHACEDYVQRLRGGGKKLRGLRAPYMAQLDASEDALDVADESPRVEVLEQFTPDVAHCSVCGKQLSGRVDQKTCSRRCRDAARKRAKPLVLDGAYSQSRAQQLVAVARAVTPDEPRSGKDQLIVALADELQRLVDDAPRLAVLLDQFDGHRYDFYASLMRSPRWGGRKKVVGRA